MPIYEYRCSQCHHELEIMQKMSEPALTQCPACGKNALSKLISRSSFQLKGSGWYISDYKNAGKSAETTAESSSSKDSDKDKAASAAKTTNSTNSSSGSSTTGTATSTSTSTTSATGAA